MKDAEYQGAFASDVRNELERVKADRDRLRAELDAAREKFDARCQELLEELEAANAARDEWRERYESVWLGDESERRTAPAAEEPKP